MCKGVDGLNNRYIVLGNLSNIEYMLKMILIFKGNNNNNMDSNACEILDKLLPLKEYKEQQIKNYHAVLEFFILLTKCQHIILEESLCNPN